MLQNGYESLVGWTDQSGKRKLDPKVRNKCAQSMSISRSLVFWSDSPLPLRHRTAAAHWRKWSHSRQEAQA